MNKLFFALFMSALCTSKAWTQDVQPEPIQANPDVNAADSTTATPKKTHWHLFKHDQTTNSQGLSLKQARALAKVVCRAGGTSALYATSPMNAYPQYGYGSLSPYAMQRTNPALGYNKIPSQPNVIQTHPATFANTTYYPLTHSSSTTFVGGTNGIMNTNYGPGYSNSTFIGY